MLIVSSIHLIYWVEITGNGIEEYLTLEQENASPKKKTSQKKTQVLTYDMVIEIKDGTSKRVINKFWKDAEKKYKAELGDKIILEVIDDENAKLTVPKGRNKLETLNEKVSNITDDLLYPKGIKLFEA